MNCKPGDLAYIVAGLKTPSPNLGKVVEIVRYAGEDVFGAEWEVRSQSAVQTRDGFGNSHMSREFFAPDAWLRPISGVPVHDEQHDEVTA